MKMKLAFSLSALVLMFCLFSCEKESKDITPLDQETNVVLKSLESEPLEVPELTEDHCGEPKVYELWYDNIPYGTVTVYNDDEFLYLKYVLLPELQNEWGITRTYLFVGESLPEGWNNGSSWYEDPPVELVNYPAPYPKEITLQVPLEEYMSQNCFIIATKVRLLSTGGIIMNPRAYIVGGGLYIWEDEYCLETCEPDPGTGTIGYWKNHPEAWPVDEIIIGGITYTRDEAIEIMKSKKVKGDKTHDMFAQLVAAKLNVEIGNSSGCINGIIASADDWMSIYNVGTGVSADSEAWKMAEDWHEMLDDYNNGRLCAPHRDD